MKTVEAYHQRTSVEKLKLRLKKSLKTDYVFFSILEAEYEKNKISYLKMLYKRD